MSLHSDSRLCYYKMGWPPCALPLPSPSTATFPDCFPPALFSLSLCSFAILGVPLLFHLCLTSFCPSPPPPRPYPSAPLCLLSVALPLFLLTSCPHPSPAFGLPTPLLPYSTLLLVPLLLPAHLTSPVISLPPSAAGPAPTPPSGPFFPPPPPNPPCFSSPAPPSFHGSPLPPPLIPFP